MKSIIISTLLFFFLVGCSDDSGNSVNPQDTPDPNNPQLTNLTGPYVGQTPPGNTPQLFLPGLITEEVHTTTIFSPDGNEVFWTPMEDGYFYMRYMALHNGFWTEPRNFDQIGSNYDGEPCYSPDGNRLYFTSWRTPDVTGIPTKENIWFLERTSEGWGEPVILPAIINELDLHWSFSFADNGNLYYGAHVIGEEDRNDIYCAEYENGSFVRKTRLGDSINTSGSEDTPFIAPDESYLMFARVHATTGYADLFICFKNADGSWGEPINMQGINSNSHELCPNVTKDGLYLFFMSMRTGRSKPYWVSASIIENYR